MKFSLVRIANMVTLTFALLPIIPAPMCHITGVTVVSHHHSLPRWHPRFGVDSYSDVPARALNDIHARFVIRYVSPGNPLTFSEHRQLSSHHIRTVIAWEYGARDVLGGYSVGRYEAQQARLGMRHAGIYHAPVYFCVDFPAWPGAQPSINAYIRGADSVLGYSRVGLYAGYGPIHRAFNAHLIKYAWQTSAWSAGLWDRRDTIRQGFTGEGNHAYGYNMSLGSTLVDYDHAMRRYYGGAGLANENLAHL